MLPRNPTKDAKEKRWDLLVSYFGIEFSVEQVIERVFFPFVLVLENQRANLGQVAKVPPISREVTPVGEEGPKVAPPMLLVSGFLLSNQRKSLQPKFKKALPR